MKKLLFIAVLTLGISCMTANAVAGIALCMAIDPDLQAWLVNFGEETFSIDAYQLTSTRGILDPVGWRSLASVVREGDADGDLIPDDTPDGKVLAEMVKTLGAASMQFDDQFNPSKDILAEVSLGSGARFTPGTKWLIGKPFATLPDAYVYGPPTTETFTIKLPGSAATYIQPLDCMPEPATIVPAVIGAAGVALAGRGRRRTSRALGLRR